MQIIRIHDDKGATIKKIAVVGKNPDKVKELKEILLSTGFSVVKKDPDAVMCIGGDGTFLYGERLYPGVPKFLLRDGSICNKCNAGALEDVLVHLHKGPFRIEESIKLAVTIRRGRRIVARRECANDVSIRNSHLPEAIRFFVSVDEKPIDGELIGDGLVVSTPFGSSAYYKSITRTTFKRGIGIAFNNLTVPERPRIVSEKSTVRVCLLRRGAHLATDNDPKVLVLHEGDEIEIRKAKHPARMIRISVREAGELDHVSKEGRRRSFR